MSEPVNSVTMKVLKPLWNESSLRTNNYLAYSNYSYSRIGPKESAPILNEIVLYIGLFSFNQCHKISLPKRYFFFHAVNTAKCNWSQRIVAE